MSHTAFLTLLADSYFTWYLILFNLYIDRILVFFFSSLGTKLSIYIIFINLLDGNLMYMRMSYPDYISC